MWAPGVLEWPGGPRRPPSARLPQHPRSNLPPLQRQVAPVRCFRKKWEPKPQRSDQEEPDAESGLRTPSPVSSEDPRGHFGGEQAPRPPEEAPELSVPPRGVRGTGSGPAGPQAVRGRPSEPQAGREQGQPSSDASPVGSRQALSRAPLLPLAQPQPWAQAASVLRVQRWKTCGKGPGPGAMSVLRGTGVGGTWENAPPPCVTRGM